jgi:hypothetical protein
MDIDKAQEKVEKASGFFDTLNAFIKKHPIWFAIIVIIALSELGYLGWLNTHPDDEYYENMEYDETWDQYADTTVYYNEQLQYSSTED